MESDPKSWKWWIAAIIFIVMLAATARPGAAAYRHFKEKRGAALAQKFLAAGDYRNALLSARLTLSLDATNVSACRVMAALAELSHSASALDWREKIVAAEPTVENKLALAKASLHFQNPPFALAEKILQDAPGPATNLVEYQAVAAELSLRRKNFREAEMHFAQAARLEPANKIFQLNLAILRLNSTNATIAGAARATLKNFQSDSNLAAQARRSLIANDLAHEQFTAARDESGQLLALPQATLADRLQYLEILQRQNDPEFSAQLKKIQQSATNAIQSAQVAGWMDGNNLSAEAVRWLTNLPAAFQAQPAVRLALVDCFLTTSNWPALGDFVSTGNWGGTDFLRMAFAARAWSELGESRVAQSDWQAAIGETPDNLGAWTTLLELAAQWGMAAQREALLWQIVQRFPRERGAARELEQIYFATGDTAGLHRLYSLMLASDPNDPGVKNNFAATSMLLQTNLPQAFALARENFLQKPGDAFIVSTYAYSLHLQGRSREGLAALQKLDETSRQQPSVALYYGVLLAATGQSNRAAAVLQGAEEKQKLLPEEKNLLTAARNRH